MTAGTELKATAQTSMLTNGTYLYGESAKPDQIGKDYIIMRIKDGQATGAVYRPHSEYYCFQGEVKGEQIKLSFKDPENGTVYSQEIAIKEIDGPIASQSIPVRRISLNGFEPIEKIAEVDREILQACTKK